jgi:diguanylate cyclase (GGDEF)-like protein/PAS domain S-box-containing protein
MTSIFLLSMILAGAIASMCLIAGTSSRRSEELLRRQNVLLDAALNNMTQGLNMFDSAGRLVLSNEHYIEMYGLAAAAVKPGMNVRDLVELRLAAGTFFKTDPAQYANELMTSIVERKPTRVTRELADGRFITVVNQPMPDGGWVVTHEDVSERWRAERELENTRNFLDIVVENVPTAIAVKDARTLEYVLINRGAEEFYGIPRAEMIGKTAQDVFSKERQAAIASNDKYLLESGRALHIGEHLVALRPNDPRIATTTRLPIMGEDGEPRYLLTVIQDVTEKKRDEARIERLAHYDSLTDLPNRAAFNACFASVLERAAMSDESFAVLSVDLDRFKEVNDIFGHSTGDRLLRAAAGRLSATLQGAFLARVGGDEFAVIVTESPAPTHAARLAERLIAALADDFEIEGHRLRIGLSVGIALYPIDGVDEVSILGNADAALYRAKAEGRGSIRFFEADMDHRLRERRAVLHDLRSAIERRQLMVYYQPQARIDGEIIGFEALARWQHPIRGQVPPSTFIPVAEESGFILEIGEWMLREACREAAGWPDALHVAINLSAIQFRHGDLAGLVHDVLLETGLAPGRLELEITESVLIDDLPRALAILRRLKALGVRIAMDDFGTGYSSLSNLQAFPFDKIKIDRSFISGLERNTQAATIVRAVIALGRGLNLPVVAEGVETQAQLDFLSNEACAEVQGYLLGRPLPIADYAGLLGRAGSPEPEAAGAKTASVA